MLSADQQGGDRSYERERVPLSNTEFGFAPFPSPPPGMRVSDAATGKPRVERSYDTVAASDTDRDDQAARDTRKMKD